MMRIAFITLGCKLNYAETSTYERELLKAGLEAVPWSKGADVFLVNTCTVTEHSDKKSRNIIRKLHRQNPDALIYVTGCYAQLKKAEIEAIEGVTCVFGATEKSRIVPTILANINGEDCCGLNCFADFCLIHTQLLAALERLDKEIHGLTQHNSDDQSCQQIQDRMVYMKFH